MPCCGDSTGTNWTAGKKPESSDVIDPTGAAKLTVMKPNGGTVEPRGEQTIANRVIKGGVLELEAPGPPFAAQFDRDDGRYLFCCGAPMLVDVAREEYRCGQCGSMVPRCEVEMKRGDAPMSKPAFVRPPRPSLVEPPVRFGDSDGDEAPTDQPWSHETAMMVAMIPIALAVWYCVPTIMGLISGG